MIHVDPYRTFTNWHAFPWTHSWLADDLSAGAVATWANGKGGAALTEATNQPTAATTSGPNSQPGVTFDGTDDKLTASIGSISQPDTLVIVGKMTGGQRFVDSTDGANRQVIGYDGASAWFYFAGSVQTGGTKDANNHTFTGYFNGASSVLEVDGASTSTANPGAQSLGTALKLGANVNDSAFTACVISAIGIYSGGDARAHALWDSALAPYVLTKWGLTL